MSAWIQHVKRFQEANGCTYKDALKHAKATYLKGSGYGSYVPDNIQYRIPERDLKKAAKQQQKQLIMDTLEDKAEQLLGMGSVGRMLKNSAAGNVVRLMDSGTSRATSEMAGRGILEKATKKQLVRIIKILGDKGAEQLSGMGAVGQMLKESAAGNTIRLMDAGTNRAVSEMDNSPVRSSAVRTGDGRSILEGGNVNRFKKANRWQTFVDTTIRDTIDTGGKAARVYYDSTNPMEQMGFGLKRHKRLSGRALMAAGY